MDTHAGSIGFEQRPRTLFCTLIEVIIEEPGLSLLDQSRQGDGRPDIGHGVVGLTMFQIVRLGHPFEIVGGLPHLVHRPVYAFPTQGPGRPDQVNYVPA